MESFSDELRNCMRHWTTGVAVVTSFSDGHQHGMTVNSFVSVSLDPPLVTVTLANTTRTCELVKSSGNFAVTILSEEQADVADRFAGRGVEPADRFEGLEFNRFDGQAPVLVNGVAGIECKVVHSHVMKNSTLFIGEVIDARLLRTDLKPLVYLNRTYYRGVGQE